MMKIVAASDIHYQFNSIKKIPDGDVLIFAGDLGNATYDWEIKYVSEFISRFPHEYKIFVSGNHDVLLTNDLIEEFYTKNNIIYLEDNSIVINGVKFYGSPWTLTFYNWNYMKDLDQIKKVWDKIDDDTDILITHGPPAGILDSVNGFPKGDPHLLDAVKRIKPKYHIFGHIHESYGKVKLGNITFMNVSICDGSYNSTYREAMVFRI